MGKETAVHHKCHHCGQGVAVKVNVAGKAYYACDYCGFKGQQGWQKTSDAYMAQIAPAPAPAPAGAPQPAAKPAPAPVPGKSPRNLGTVLG